MMLRTLGIAAIAACTTTVTANAATTQVDGGQTSVALDLELLESVGLAISGVSDDVIVPGSLPGSVAFGVNARTGDLPTTFAYDADDFVGTFGGTIEHLGSVFFNDDTLQVGDFTIGFDPGRVSDTTSGFFVESTAGLAGILFDVAPPSGLGVSATALTVAGDLLVSPELDMALGGMGALAGADVGDALVEAAGYVVRSRVIGGETFGDTSQTSVLLDTELLSMVGLDLSSVSEDVLIPGDLEGSVAFAVNRRTESAPLLPTTFSYDPADFLGSFAGTIEHAGSVFFNDDTLQVGNFTIGFDPDRISKAGASGFFVESTVGLAAVLFDVAAPSELEATEQTLTIAADLLVSPELDAALGGKGALTGADVGDALVSALAQTAPMLPPTIGSVIEALEPDAGNRKVHQAIESLEEALERLADDGLVRRVFDNMAKAVKKLTQSDGDYTGEIDSLRLASRALAVSAFDEGLAGGGDDRDLQRALRELSKGDDDAADGKPDQAIKRYGKAWERARDSLG